MMMNYDLFEGEKHVRTVVRDEDAKFFRKAMDKLKFSRDIDLLIFCASLGLYRSAFLKKEAKEINPRLTKLVSMPTFETAKLFDFTIMSLLDVDKNRMDEFESYFYTGFKILEKWFKDNMGGMGDNTLEIFCAIIDDMLSKPVKESN